MFLIIIHQFFRNIYQENFKITFLLYNNNHSFFIKIILFPRLDQLTIFYNFLHKIPLKLIYNITY